MASSVAIPERVTVVASRHTFDVSSLTNKRIEPLADESGMFTNFWARDASNEFSGASFVGSATHATASIATKAKISFLALSMFIKLKG
jgi:hypothetical protein